MDDNNADGSAILVEMVIAAPPETVWAALRSRTKLGKWFGWDYPGLAEQIELIFFSSAQEDRARRVLQFGTWQGSSYSFEVLHHPEGALARVRRSPASTDPDWRARFDEISEGWLTFVGQLRLMLEKHRNQKRRTIYLSGAALKERKSPSRALRIGGLFEAKVGRKYTAVTGPGDRLQGTIFFRSQFQLGLLVTQWGNGLLAVIDRPAGPDTPYGGGSAVLTTYGLTEAEFRGLDVRWRNWWNERYPPVPTPSAEAAHGASAQP